MSMCSDCTKNIHLKERISREGVNSYCSICELDKNHVFDIERLAEVFALAIKQNFGTGAVRYVLDDNDRDWTEPEGDTLETIVSEMLEQDIEFLDDLIEAIVATEDFWPPDGGEAFFEADALYTPVERDQSVDYFTPHWRYIIGELKHKRRFFSESVRTFFDELFKDVEKVKTWKEDARTTQNVIQYAAQGMTVYRGRVIEPEDAQNILGQPFKEVGPTPRSKARSGRMSAEGVVALYCAMDEETAIAELRPAIGNIMAVIALRLSSPLRLLNFERLERALDEGWGACLAYDYDAIRNTRGFLRRLHDLISQPVVPGHESDYLITQTMAEYLAHVHEPHFDGIIFKSVQRAGGMNVVIFPERNMLGGSEDTFPVDYVPDSLKFHQTQRVEYTHLPLKAAFFSKSGVSLIPSE